MQGQGFNSFSTDMCRRAAFHLTPGQNNDKLCIVHIFKRDVLYLHMAHEMSGITISHSHMSFRKLFILVFINNNKYCIIFLFALLSISFRTFNCVCVLFITAALIGILFQRYSPCLPNYIRTTSFLFPIDQ